jgi:hypothetical protein
MSQFHDEILPLAWLGEDVAQRRLVVSRCTLEPFAVKRIRQLGFRSRSRHRGAVLPRNDSKLALPFDGDHEASLNLIDPPLSTSAHPRKQYGIRFRLAGPVPPLARLLTRCSAIRTDSTESTFRSRGISRRLPPATDDHQRHGLGLKSERCRAPRLLVDPINPSPALAPAPHKPGPRYMQTCGAFGSVVHLCRSAAHRANRSCKSSPLLLPKAATSPVFQRLALSKPLKTLPKRLTFST